MKFYDNFKNLYSVEKTIRIGLIPQFETEKNIVDSLKNDEIRAKNFKIAKQGLDKVYRKFIEDKLSNVKIDSKDLEVYIEELKDKNDEKKEKGKEIRTYICNSLENWSKSSKIIKDIEDRDKYDYLSKDEIEIMKSFKGFSTYFKQYDKNRENIFKDKDSTSIVYRIVNDNLPKYYINITTLNNDNIKNLNLTDELSNFINDIKLLRNFDKYLKQVDINNYNSRIGNINILINRYNQKCDKENRIRKLKPLYNQILSKEDKGFFIEKFNDDKDLLDAINKYVENDLENLGLVENLKNKLENLFNYDLSKIYVKNDSTLANDLYNNWSFFRDIFYDEKDEDKKANKGKKNKKDEKDKLSLKEINENIKIYNNNLEDKIINIDEIIKNKCTENVKNLSNNYDKFKTIIGDNLDQFKDKTDIRKNNDNFSDIKNLCDSIKSIEYIVKYFVYDENLSDNFDFNFYDGFDDIRNTLVKFDRIYNMTRNYITEKPYSQEKIRLMFDSSSFLSGWSTKNTDKKENDYGKNKTHIIKYKNNYYLMIVNNKALGKSDKKLLDGEGEKAIHYIYQQQKVDSKNLARVFITTENNIKDYKLPIEDISDMIYRDDEDKQRVKENVKDAPELVARLVDYYKIGLLKHDSYEPYRDDLENNWKKNSKEYTKISEFTSDIAPYSYRIDTENIDFDGVKELVKNGKVFLFKIYNKDFSKYSKGIPNLHTLYFKMLFDYDNLENKIFKLNADAKVFYRKKSLDLFETTVHYKIDKLKNKNLKNPKEYSKFDYDIIKDRRYTVDKFVLHMPITLNFACSKKCDINKYTKDMIKNADDIKIIGIDRGERNLLYYSVIDKNGNILEQSSLNTISNTIPNKQYTISTNYNELLEDRETQSKNNQKNWISENEIKNLKTGYLSQVVHQITNLMVKYNAILVLEDLNSGFVQNRSKFRKNVYHQFEKAIIDKLNFLVDKTKDKNEDGGLFNAYQLSDKFESFKDLGIQSGVIFYVNPYLTSKIDPITGFVNKFYIKYKNIEKAKEFWGKFKDIRYNKGANYFEFEFDYKEFIDIELNKTEWTVCTYGDRIKSYKKNNHSAYETINLTEKLKEFFEENSIDINGDIKNQIVSKDDKNFFVKLFNLFKLVVQLRNYDNKGNDYIISPVKDKKGNFYDSRKVKDNSLPTDADANGAYNIARKGLILVEKIKNGKKILNISNKEWLDYAQDLKKANK